MVLWQADLRVSWRAQWLSLALHGVLILIILFLPWPLNYMPLWLLLLFFVLLGFVRSQRRINGLHGEIQLLEDGSVVWLGLFWRLAQRPWMQRSVVLLVLHGSHEQRRTRLWVHADSMEDQQWRDFRRVLGQMVTANNAEHTQ